ncbi:6-carboxytetrahydropterin synthase [Colwellia sp. BRX10-3]|uniref:6-carboxytetrahydropterin synthase n=1 Tax=Colwellia sp. BRX10-3 TaxID=2759844 RepID=UPI0015F4A3BE|nr:6-carboxytetrahydropterin synthase [Colwellia sp. BRX10-3]MBA6390860.1 6-carboxytetrahydropterin synthase [Colwellia sp. BRX10-3]
MQLFVNDLTVIDFSYCCAARGIVGESWIVDVLLDGSLNEMSMVLDFAVVKKQIKAIIDDAVDHKLLLPMQDNAISVEVSTERSGHEFVNFSSKQGAYYLQSPSCAFAKIDTKQIDIASITEYLTKIILTHLPKNVQGLTLNLRPEVIDGAYYHYTHGLKLHDGNCQRIAHGHRSKIHIYKNGQRSAALEEVWSLRWQDIYLASEADRMALSDIELSETAIANLTPKHQLFSYFAPQGRFDIAVPNTILDVVDCDSTVELLADFIVRQLKKQSPIDEFKVVAFEGVAKGAIANG